MTTTKKTNDTAANDAVEVTVTPPAGLAQTTAAKLVHPQAGGTYLRQTDGSLVAKAPEGALQAPEPGCHFDAAPQGEPQA